MKTLSAIIFAVSMLAIAAILLVGCQPAPSAQAQKQVQALIDQGAVQHQQQVNTDTAVTQAAKDSPTSHPLVYNDQTILQLHPILFWTFIGFCAAALAEFILSFTKFDLLSPFGMSFGVGAAVCGAALFALPFIPWVFYAVCIVGAVVVIGDAIQQMVSARGNIGTALHGIVVDLGGHAQGSTGTTTTTHPLANPVTIGSVQVISASQPS